MIYTIIRSIARHATVRRRTSCRTTFARVSYHKVPQRGRHGRALPRRRPVKYQRSTVSTELVEACAMLCYDRLGYIMLYHTTRWLEALVSVRESAPGKICSGRIMVEQSAAYAKQPHLP